MSLYIHLLGENITTSCYACGQDHTKREQVYQANITHNLGEMAKEAGIYEALWRPYRLRVDFSEYLAYANSEEEFENTCLVLSKDIVDLVQAGLNDLRERPNHFKQFNSKNGWGLYRNFVPFVENYLNALKRNPNAQIKISR